MAKVCKVDGCESGGRFRRGYCQKHYDRFMRHGDPLGGGVFRVKLGDVCVVDGCENQPRARQMCHKHYMRWKKYGDPHKVAWEYGAKSRREWHVDRAGYVIRRDPYSPAANPNGIVYKHRHVMCEHLGRALHPGENVHHINGDKTDNRLENLELWLTGQPAGQRVQDKIKWHLSEILESFDAAIMLCDEPETLLDLMNQVSKFREE